MALVALLALHVVGLPERRASAAGVMSLIEWDAPAACAGAPEVHERLSRLLGYEPDTLGKLSRVRGSVVATAKGYRLVLEALERDRRSSRLFEAARCEDLVDTAVLAIALAIAPEQGFAIGNAGVAIDAEEATTAYPPAGAVSAKAAAAPRSNQGGADHLAVRDVLVDDVR